MRDEICKNGICKDESWRKQNTGSGENKIQEQASLKLDEVKAIIEELKGLIINA